MDEYENEKQVILYEELDGRWHRGTILSMEEILIKEESVGDGE